MATKIVRNCTIATTDLAYTADVKIESGTITAIGTNLKGSTDVDRDVPLRGGLSHNEAEEISPEWAAAGTDVLFHAVCEVAGVVS